MNPEYSGLLGLVGDIKIHEANLRQRRDQNAPFDQAIAALESHGLAIGNLEMPLSTRGYRVPKHSNIRSNPEVIAEVLTMGIQAVSLANNHMMDYGPDALIDTLATCA
ncbi:MAG TPA: CapA family protein, partial [Thermomicrobiales bacterium]|nr:CapA family protein [Thermomicrobiales bacterium]